MNDIVINVKDLSKLYLLGESQAYRTLRESINSFFLKTLKRRKSSREFIWALKDISFEVKKGEVIGIIGRNGSGKTTLLKILSRITPPTEGRAEVLGRAGSLLEVGTGFHPELTGRDNIFLNGAILGMRKKEITRKFDEIVNFAEIERFIDTPIKHYSSGMYVRLAFAVAAHLEPEILLVDEVLAVGDIAFQKKCLGKMGDVAESGRTVLFVSHQMNQIRRLCQRCIWLDSGKIKKIGNTVEIVSAYESSFSQESNFSGRQNINRNSGAAFLSWEILEPRQEKTNVLDTLSKFKIRFLIKANKPLHNCHHGISLYNNENQLMWGTATVNISLEEGEHELVYELPSLPLKPSAYFWRVSFYDDNGLVDVWDAVPELIVATAPVTHFIDEYAGIINMPYNFYIKRI